MQSTVTPSSSLRPLLQPGETDPIELLTKRLESVELTSEQQEYLQDADAYIHYKAMEGALIEAVKTNLISAKDWEALKAEIYSRPKGRHTEDIILGELVFQVLQRNGSHEAVPQVKALIAKHLQLQNTQYLARLGLQLTSRGHKITEELYRRRVQGSVDKAAKVTEAVNKRLELAELLKQSVADLDMTDEQVAEKLLALQEQQSEAMAAQLLGEVGMSNASSSGGKKGKKRKGKRGKKAARRKGKDAQRAQQGPQTPVCRSFRPRKVVVSTSSKISWQAEMLHHLQTGKKLDLPETKRVTHRWMELDYRAIRTFDEGAYADKTQEEIKRQRAYHYLPGLERIVKSRLKDLYSFVPKSGGHGIRCELIHSSGEKEIGTVYIGYGERETYKMNHRYFKSDGQFETAQEIFNGVQFDKVEKDADWSTIGAKKKGYDFRQIDSDGAIVLEFPHADHYVRILPQRRRTVLDMMEKD